MEKEFEINGCIIVPEDVSYDLFWDKLIEFVESNDWLFGGDHSEYAIIKLTELDKLKAIA